MEDSLSLKAYIDLQIRRLEDGLKHRDDNVLVRFDSLDKALILASRDAQDKYSHLNKLRDEVTTDRNMLVPKVACEIRQKEIDSRISKMEHKLTILETRSVTWTAAVGVFFLIINTIMHFLK